MSSEVDRLIKTDDSTTETPRTDTQIRIKKDPSRNLTGALLLRNRIHLHAQSTGIRIDATTAISTGISPENALRTKRTLRN